MVQEENSVRESLTICVADFDGDGKPGWCSSQWAKDKPTIIRSVSAVHKARSAAPGQDQIPRQR